MNKRIKELALQANGFFHLRWDGREGSVEFQTENLEKFVELIVSECAYVSEGYFGFKDHTPGTAIAKEIKEHFEVEE